MRILIKNQQRLRTINRIRIKKAALRTLSLLGQSTVELSILFVGDRRMRKLNTFFRGVSETTDVLSFPQQDSNKAETRDERQVITRPSSLLLGDIVINTHQANRQAKRYGVSFYNEIYRLLIHGILHLLGYNHEKGGRKAMIMKKREEEILNAIRKIY